MPMAAKATLFFVSSSLNVMYILVSEFSKDKEPVLESWVTQKRLLYISLRDIIFYFLRFINICLFFFFTVHKIKISFVFYYDNSHDFQQASF